MGEKKIETWWNDAEIDGLKLSFLNTMFTCKTQEAVDVTYAFAKYMGGKKLDPDNYPIFLKLLESGNHWVIDALLNNNDPLTFFKKIQPNSFIISECFRMLINWKPGEIYPKLFLVILGIIKIAYENGKEGYRIFPITPKEINSIGKQLNKDEGQKSPTNEAVLHILDSIAAINEPEPPGDKKMEKAATHANNIRGKFLDQTKNLNEAIPEKLLIKGNYLENEIAPSGFSKK